MSQPVHRLGGHAMATEFQILIAGVGKAKAEAAAAEALRDLESLENELSRFRDGSDIARINALPAGGSTTIGTATYDCIALAKDVHAATAGAFDISIGPLFAVWTNPDHSPRTPTESELSRARAAVGIDQIELGVDSLRITVHNEDRWLDLGGIGKGYALDQMAILLGEANIDNALLDAGGSTLLAIGDGPEGEGWPVGRGIENSPAIALKDRALSGSAFTERGEHIVDPRKGRPVSAFKGNAWALAPSAALADALSTAFLVMDIEEIEALCAAYPEIEAILPSYLS